MKCTYTLPDIPFVIADTMPLKDDEHLITRIEVIRGSRGKGHATQLLKLILEDADREGAILHLQVDPDYSIGSLDQDKLRSWYMRNGFSQVLDPNDPNALTRLPQLQS